MDRTVHGRLDVLPRVFLMSTPTPLEPAPRLSQELDIELFFKRDDLTGVGCGGNKLRKLELILGPAMEAGVDTLLTTGGAQSNHARLTAAAATRMGLSCELFLKAEKQEGSPGNLLLDRLLGAHVRFCGIRPYEEIDAEMANRAAELRSQGRTPLVIPLGGATPDGTLGYAVAFRELLEQFEAFSSAPDVVILAGGSGSTAAGLSLGVRWWASATRVVVISVSWCSEDLKDAIAKHFQDAADHLGKPTSFNDACEIYDSYIGPGYSQPSVPGIDALRRVARSEGIVLDTTYTAKAMSGLIDLCHQSEIKTGSRVVFLHTGGVPELFSRDSAKVLTS